MNYDVEALLIAFVDSASKRGLSGSPPECPWWTMGFTLIFGHLVPNGGQVYDD